MLSTKLILAAVLLAFLGDPAASFAVQHTSRSQSFAVSPRATVHGQRWQPLFEKKGELDDGVVELADTDDTTKEEATSNAPNNFRFISQGEIDPETLNPDLSDPKQARVIIYIIISLIPVLFLIPLMLGSRELIPLEDFPPVQL